MSILRLDKWLVDHHYFESREKAQQAIEAGAVLVNQKPILKSSFPVDENDEVVVASSPLKYVSRGGNKLEKAIREFQIDFKGKTILDIGASTGGFTDCALQYGAEKVFAVDVGKDQLHPSLRSNPRVISLEETDIRKLTAADLKNEIIDIVVADVSFISLKKIFPSVLNFLKSEGIFIALVKPQFEVGSKKHFKKGIVKDSALRKKILDEMITEAESLGFKTKGKAETDYDGMKKNLEYLIYFIKKANE